MTEPQHDDDGQRMRRFASGDRAAFEELVRTWEKPLGRFLNRLLPDSHRAADLLQECFLKVFLNGHRYREAGQFRVWIYRIALNSARDEARRIARKPMATMPADWEPSSFHDDGSERSELAEIVRRALADLPAPQRETVVLRHYQDLSFEDMARVLDVPATTLKSRFAVAMKKLESELRPKFAD